MKYKIRYKATDEFNREEFIKRTESFFEKLYPTAKLKIIDLTTFNVIKIKSWFGDTTRIYLCDMNEMTVVKLEQLTSAHVQENVTFTKEELLYFDRVGFELDPIYSRKEYNQDITDWFGDIK